MTIQNNGSINSSISSMSQRLLGTWNVTFGGRKINVFDDKNEKYRSALFDKISCIVGAAFVALLGTVLILTGHPYLGIASYAFAVAGFSDRNREIIEIEKSDLFKQQIIHQLGGQGSVDAFPEVQWAHFKEVSTILRKRAFFPIITPENMTQPTMRIVENGELLGIATFRVTRSHLKKLTITCFKPFVRYPEVKKEDMPGWNMVTVEDRKDKKTVFVDIGE